MSGFDRVVLFITTGTEQEARTIADLLVNQRKAACANIVSQVHSVFRWKGETQSDRESLLIVKTRASLLDEVVRLVRNAHSYEVPEIVALPVVGGNEDYLQWLDGEVAG